MFKAAGLGEVYREVRPKRLGFAIFSQVGGVVRQAGEQFLRVTQQVLEKVVWRWRRGFHRRLWEPASG